MVYFVAGILMIGVLGSVPMRGTMADINTLVIVNSIQKYTYSHMILPTLQCFSQFSNMNLMKALSIQKIQPLHTETWLYYSFIVLQTIVTMHYHTVGWYSRL